jgi:hypothetical protein
MVKPPSWSKLFREGPAAEQADEGENRMPSADKADGNPQASIPWPREKGPASLSWRVGLSSVVPTGSCAVVLTASVQPPAPRTARVTRHASHLIRALPGVRSSGTGDLRGRELALAARAAAVLDPVITGTIHGTAPNVAAALPPAMPPHAHVLIAIARLLACTLSASRSSGSGRSRVTRIPSVSSLPGCPCAPGRPSPAGRASVSGRSRAPGRTSVTRIPRVPRIPGRASLSGWCRRASRTSRTRCAWWPLVATDKSQGKSEYHRAEPHNEGIPHL